MSRFGLEAVVAALGLAAVGLVPGPVRAQGSLERDLAAARAALQRGDAQAAQERAEAVLVLKPDHPLALATRARARELLGELGGAVDDAKAALEQRPQAQGLRWLYARLQLELGFELDALVELRVLTDTLAEGSPLRPAVAAALRRAHEALEQQPAAARRREGDFARKQAGQELEHARQALREGDQERALSSLTLALAWEPELVPARLERAELWLQRSQAGRALEDYGQAVKARPTDASLWLARARCLLQAGRAREAAADLDRALELEPELGPALELRGLARLKLGRLEGAIADFGHAVARGARSGLLQLRLGQARLLRAARLEAGPKRQAARQAGWDDLRKAARLESDALRPVLWLALTGGGRDLLQQRLSKLSGWQRSQADFGLGQLDGAALREAARAAPRAKRAGRLCQVACYLGLESDAEEDPERARARYAEALTAAVGEPAVDVERDWAQARWAQLGPPK